MFVLSEGERGGWARSDRRGRNDDGNGTDTGYDDV